MLCVSARPERDVMYLSPSRARHAQRDSDLCPFLYLACSQLLPRSFSFLQRNMAYAPQKPMTARPNPRGLALDAAGEREWDHSFFDMDVETCCFACWCPCMVRLPSRSPFAPALTLAKAYSQAHSKIQHLEANGTPHPTGGEFCGSSSWTFCVAQHLGVGWILATMQRTDVRKRYGLRGDGCMGTSPLCPSHSTHAEIVGPDCLGSAFCFAFAQTQQLREISVGPLPSSVSRGC